MSNTPAKQVVWIDCEMTGLDIDRDGLCELAIIITDFDLKPLDPGLEIIIDPGADALEHMSDYVRNMHETSGLLPLLQDGVSVATAEKQAIEYVERFVDKGRRPVVAGNTIGMDRRFISKFLPTFDERMHYRSIDVSTIKELSRRWFPAAFYAAPEKDGGHRALADIAESIRELAYFRSTVLVEGPGPDQAASKRVANQISDEFASLTGRTESPTGGVSA